MEKVEEEGDEPDQLWINIDLYICLYILKWKLFALLYNLLYFIVHSNHNLINVINTGKGPCLPRVQKDGSLWQRGLLHIFPLRVDGATRRAVWAAFKFHRQYDHVESFEKCVEDHHDYRCVSRYGNSDGAFHVIIWVQLVDGSWY